MHPLPGGTAGAVNLFSEYKAWKKLKFSGSIEVLNLVLKCCSDIKEGKGYTSHFLHCVGEIECMVI